MIDTSTTGVGNEVAQIWAMLAELQAWFDALP
jgi:hypothetical protein